MTASTVRRVARELHAQTAQATTVECLECGATVGDVCVVHDVPQLRPHAQRVWNARHANDTRRTA